LAALPLIPADLIANYTTALSALYSGVSALGAWLAVRALRDERLERGRPVVRADCPVSSSSEVFFRLSNTGGGPAEAISVAFDPSPVDFNGRALSENSLFKSPLPLLVPGQELKHFFQMGFNFSKPNVPARFSVIVSYAGQGERYQETTVIDLGQYRDMTLPRPTAQESLANIAKTLETLQGATERVASEVARMRTKEEGDA